LRLAANGAPEDRYWAYNGLISVYNTEYRWDDAAEAAKNSLALRPGAFVPNFFLTRISATAQREEAALAAAKTALATKRDSDISAQSWATMRLEIQCWHARLQGDLLRSMEFCNQARLMPNVVAIRPESMEINLLNAAGLHDAAALQAALAEFKANSDPKFAADFAVFGPWNELNMGHWSAPLIGAASAGEIGGRRILLAINGSFANTNLLRPPIALATARSGNLKTAHAIIDRTPLDCSLCLRTRGKIDAIEKNWSGAVYWFETAVRNAPTTPFPYMDWAQMLLDRGDFDAAIAKFKLANQKGPHFADPLEGWGEALIAKNQSHLALAKFAEAEKYAPNWGRLHLKWGEALAYAGKRDEAAKQFVRAAQLDLAPSEKTELARHP